VGQQGRLTRIWAERGSRPAMVRDNRRCSTYLFGAICPARGIGAAIISQAVNTAAMNFHLTEIASQVAPGARAVVLIDGAGWHEKAKDLRVPDNITLMTLPPYSPELNSMENVWNYLRDNKLSNTTWDDEAAINTACKQAWNFLTNTPDVIRSLGTREWACVSL
jgi:DDE superfamily endonuclease